ncbi:MAG: glycosyltransferase family 9 protein [Prevotella sp.]|nr:glycosyltransferase family 9 protein [Prevotella sp.]
MKHEHILIIRFSALGDVAMTVPIVWALARQYPELRITVLSRPISRTFFEDLAPNVNFMAADLKNEYHGLKGLNALFRRLVAKQFTAIADLHSVLRSEYLRFRFKLGNYKVAHLNKHRNMRRKLVAKQPKKVMRPLPTPFQNYLDVFAKLGYPIDPKYLNFRSIFDVMPAPADGDNAAELVRGTGNLNMLPKSIGQKRSWEQWIGIAPFATYEGKIYPLKKMEEVIEKLIERYPKARIFFFGRGEKEEAAFSEWTKRWKQSLYVGENTENLYQELILMSHLDVMVSMDSSNMHMASLTGTPVVSIWGATHPFAGFLGWKQSQDNIVQCADLDCRPCSIYGKQPCMRGDYACMNNITPEQVVEKIAGLLQTDK